MRDVHHLDEAAARALEPALRQDARLRRAARARGEQKEVDAPLVDLHVGDGGALVGCEHCGVVGAVDVEDPPVRSAEVEAVEQVRVAAFGDDELAVGVGDVAGELGATACRVDADDDGVGERGRTEPHRELGDVVEEQADVRRRVRVEGRLQARGACRARVEVLAPGVGLVLESDRGAIAVRGAGLDVLGDAGHERVGELQARAGPVEGQEATAARWRHVGGAVTLAAEGDVGGEPVGHGDVLVARTVRLHDAEALADGGDHHGAALLDGEGVEVALGRLDDGRHRAGERAGLGDVPGQQAAGVALGDVDLVAGGGEADAVGAVEPSGRLDDLRAVDERVVERPPVFGALARSCRSR